MYYGVATTKNTAHRKKNCRARSKTLNCESNILCSQTPRGVRGFSFKVLTLLTLIGHTVFTDTQWSLCTSWRTLNDDATVLE